MTGDRISDAIQVWRARLGEDAVSSGAVAQRRYGECTTGIERSIPAALTPKGVDDIVAIVEIARHYSIPLYPISTGHNWGYGSANPVIDGCVIVDLSGLDRILDMDAELGLVTLEPGVTQGALYDYLHQNNLPFLVPATGAGPSCSLVGNALERGYGMTPCADHFAAVTALEAVLPNGQIYRSALNELGGEAVDRAFKWGIGPYLDGLFAQGNLGIVTRMTIALARRPERTEVFFFGIVEDAGLEAGVVAIRRVLRAVGGITGAVNLMNSRRVLAMMLPYPQTRIGDDGILPADVVAGYADDYRLMAWMGLGALYGTAEVVGAARRIVREILKPAVKRLRFVTPASALRLNHLLRRIPGLRNGHLAKRVRTLDAAVQLLAGKPSEVSLPLAYWRSGQLPRPGAAMDPARDGAGLIWYSPLVLMSPDHVRRYVAMIGEVCASHRIEPLVTLTSLSDRCFDSSVPILFDRQDASQTALAQACSKALFAAGRREGFLPYRMGIHSMDWITGCGGSSWDMIAAIKHAVDPDGIIAPGRYAPR